MLTSYTISPQNGWGIRCDFVSIAKVRAVERNAVPFGNENRKTQIRFGDDTKKNAGSFGKDNQKGKDQIG